MSETAPAFNRTPEYHERNLGRRALTVNPAKACQPFGGHLAALGFADTLPLVHGSQGCVAYFRNSLSRHFREPAIGVSSSLTEDSAVYGGKRNLKEALGNAYALYRPRMIAVESTCMTEVIGDDLGAIIKEAKADGMIPPDLPVPFAHTPSFKGSHTNGYDAMLRGILQEIAREEPYREADRLNLIPGLVSPADIREVSRLLGEMDIPHTILADYSETLDSPLDGEYRLYPGGTDLEAASRVGRAAATLALQAEAGGLSARYLADRFGQEAVVIGPVGIEATDEFLMTAARLTGRPIPESLTRERGRLVDAMTDAHQYLHGLRVAVFGDPDLVLGLARFLLEMGAEPRHLLATNGGKAFEKRARRLLAESPFGRESRVWPGRDLWHLRSILLTDPVDLILGDSHGKYVARELNLPLVRVGYPLFDRVNLHRYPILGYQGALNLLTWIANTMLERLDAQSDDPHFELLR